MGYAVNWFKLICFLCLLDLSFFPYCGHSLTSGSSGPVSFTALHAILLFLSSLFLSPFFTKPGFKHISSLYSNSCFNLLTECCNFINHAKSFFHCFLQELSFTILWQLALGNIFGYGSGA